MNRTTIKFEFSKLGAVALLSLVSLNLNAAKDAPKAVAEKSFDYARLTEMSTAVGRLALGMASSIAESKGTCSKHLKLAHNGLRVANGAAHLWNHNPVINPLNWLSDSEGTYYTTAWLAHDIVMLAKDINAYMTDATRCGAAACTVQQFAADNANFENIASVLKTYVLPALEGGTAFCAAYSKEAKTRRHMASIGSLSRMLDKALSMDRSTTEGKAVFAATVAHVALSLYEYKEVFAFGKKAEVKPADDKAAADKAAADKAAAEKKVAEEAAAKEAADKAEAAKKAAAEGDAEGDVAAGDEEGAAEESSEAPAPITKSRKATTSKTKRK